MSKAASWKELPDLPNTVPLYTVLFQTESLIVSPCGYGDEIYKYSFSKDTWMEYTLKMKNHGVIISGVAHKSKIYLCTNKSKIVIMELINGTNKYEEIKNLKKPPGTHKWGAPVIVDDDFHYIANRHFKYNSNTKILEYVPNAPMREHTTMRNVIRVKDKLMLFGSRWHYRNIFEYDIKTNCWRCLPVKLPIGIGVVSCTLILKGQMILIIAADHRELFLYELKKQVITKTSILCPTNNCYRAFSMNDQKKDILITNGWIRDTVEVLNIYLPVYLIQIIESYYINEFIYTLNEVGKFYKIDLFEILNDC